MLICQGQNPHETGPMYLTDDGRTDGQTDGQTDSLLAGRGQYNFAYNWYYFNCPGSRHSGKTAVAHHLRMASSSNQLPSESERLEFKVKIYRNVITAAQRVAKRMQELQVSFESELPDETVETIMALEPDEMSDIKPMLILMIGTMWKDNAVQTWIRHHGELGLGDSTK